MLRSRSFKHHSRWGGVFLRQGKGAMAQKNGANYELSQLFE